MHLGAGVSGVADPQAEVRPQVADGDILAAAGNQVQHLAEAGARGEGVVCQARTQTG